jgi:hypothetical protein
LKRDSSGRAKDKQTGSAKFPANVLQVCVLIWFSSLLSYSANRSVRPIY